MHRTDSRDTLARSISAGMCLVLGAVFVWGAWRFTGGFDVWTFEGRRQVEIAAGTLRAPVVALRLSDGTLEPAPWHTVGAPAAAYLVDFIYTRCPSVCRVLGNEYQQMQRELLARADDDPGYSGVQLLSVSFDVEHDTAAQLHEVATRLGARAAYWRLAVPASMADAQILLRALGVVAIPDGAGGFVHNGDIHLLDQQGRLRALFSFDEWRRALAAARELAAR